MRHRRQLVISPETGLREALQSLTADQPRTVDETATRIAMSMDKVPAGSALTGGGGGVRRGRLPALLSAEQRTPCGCSELASQAVSEAKLPPGSGWRGGG